ncbi:MAG: FAD-dependent oxidoreductase [Candidatus Thiodiazotropha sp.]
MKIAAIGSGISGLSAAWLLNKEHAVTLYEAADYLGGHTHSVEVELDGFRHPVDTGFLVYNDLTYPNLRQLFNLIGVETHETEMTFSVNLPESDLEWAGANLGTLFAQKRNLMRLYYWRMLSEILKFNRNAERRLAWSEPRRLSLGHLLNSEGYSESFRNGYLLPMAAAIWSSSPEDILDFPASTFLRFCINHRLLQITERPTWRSLVGGGKEYVKRLAESLDVRLGQAVVGVTRDSLAARVSTQHATEEYDAVILATHAPDSLRILQDASEQESDVLEAFSYQPNRAVLHCDTRFLPQRPSLWSAWNYLSTQDEQNSVCVTYLLNRLQRLPFNTPVMVTLNPPKHLEPENQLGCYHYDHPLYDQAAIDAQARLSRIQGSNRAWFCGAWGGYGFHEDGLKSALRIIPDFGVEAPWQVVL